jgi:branched-chain amino acid transport system substrate-binding protein
MGSHVLVRRVSKEFKSGTPQFRQALRDAIEKVKNLTLTQGIYSMSPSDHNGADERSQVLVNIESGKWRYRD